jgi:hypothetical protein
LRPAAALGVVQKKERLTSAWSDVRRVRITRAEPLQRDYVSLLIVLPDREIHLGRGDQPDVVSTFIERYDPADRIDVDIAGERPARRIDVEKLLEKHDKESRRFRILIWAAVIYVAAIPLMAVCDGRVAFAIVMTFVCGGFLATLLVFKRNEHRHERRKLEEWLASYPASE